jgi:hypothetical protein
MPQVGYGIHRHAIRFHEASPIRTVPKSVSGRPGGVVITPCLTKATFGVTEQSLSWSEITNFVLVLTEKALVA